MFEDILISGYGDKSSIARYVRRGSDYERIWSDDISAPSFLSIHGKWCVAASEQSKNGIFHAYGITDGGLEKTDSVTLPGDVLCHIYYSPLHKTVYGACYRTGHVLAVGLEEGKFGEVRNHFIQGEGEGLTRAHCCAPSPDGRWIYVTNIALDRIYVYSVSEGRLTPNKGFAYLQLPLGEGPRHMTFHPSVNKAYVITEYSNRIIELNYSSETGALAVLEAYDTLPSGYGEKSTGSGLVFSKGVLYAANRGANTIGVFKADSNGSLEKIQDFGCCGNWPRHIDVSLDGESLAIANQYSNNVALVKISDSDGTLVDQTADIPFQEPSFAGDLSRG